MNEQLTEIVVILDKSGSMAGLTQDTIGGYNSFLKAQKALPGQAVLTLVLFEANGCLKTIYERKDLNLVPDLSDTMYVADGPATALHEAVCVTVDRVGSYLAMVPESVRPGKVIVAIITDGMENDSKSYSARDVKQRIEHQREKYGWQFLFMGANQDAILSAKTIGIAAQFAATYSANKVGMASAYKSMSDAMMMCRANSDIDESWKRNIQ